MIRGGCCNLPRGPEKSPIQPYVFFFDFPAHGCDVSGKSSGKVSHFSAPAIIQCTRSSVCIELLCVCVWALLKYVSDSERNFIFENVVFWRFFFLIQLLLREKSRVRRRIVNFLLCPNVCIIFLRFWINLRPLIYYVFVVEYVILTIGVCDEFSNNEIISLPIDLVGLCLKSVVEFQPGIILFHFEISSKY